MRARVNTWLQVRARALCCDGQRHFPRHIRISTCQPSTPLTCRAPCPPTPIIASVPQVLNRAVPDRHTAERKTIQGRTFKRTAPTPRAGSAGDA
jgi:hypothetical protein